MKQLVPICQDMIEKGTPKQAKQAIRCLYKNLGEHYSIDIVDENSENGVKTVDLFADILEVSNLYSCMPDINVFHFKESIFEAEELPTCNTFLVHEKAQLVNKKSFIWVIKKVDSNLPWTLGLQEF